MRGARAGPDATKCTTQGLLPGGQAARKCDLAFLDGFVRLTRFPEAQIVDTIKPFSEFLQNLRQLLTACWWPLFQASYRYHYHTAINAERLATWVRVNM